MRSNEHHQSDHTFSRRDAAIAVVLFIVVALGSWSYLTLAGETPGQWHAGAPVMCIPPALWVMGHGMSELPPFLIPPAFADFLMQKTDTFSPDQMPPHPICFARKDKFIFDRIYLLYLIGLLWKMVGISWSSLNLIVSVVGGLVAALSYGIFRLGLTRLLSVAGVVLFVSSPAYLVHLPAIRDFCKAPFILGAILAVGYLISRKPSKRFLVLLASAMGVYIGIGIGFRQDTIICVPPILAAILFARGEKPFPLWYKSVAAAVFLACFLIPAYPVLRMNKDTGGNNAFYLIQGFSRFMMENADTKRASYGPLIDDHDFHVHAIISHYDNQTRETRRTSLVTAQAGLLLNTAAEFPSQPAAALAHAALAQYCDPALDIWSKESEETGRRMVRELASTFPADVIARWYGATFRCIRGLQGKNAFFDRSVPFIKESMDLREPLARHLRTFGLFYAAAALPIIGLHGVRMGLGAAFIPLYFCGYTSLAFQMRHAFHLDIAAYWFAGFLLSIPLRAIRGGIGGTSLRAIPAAIGLPHVPLRVMCGRVLASVLLLAAILCIPLYPARLYQILAVNPLMNRYQNAALEPIPTTQRPEPNGMTLVEPAALPDFGRTFFSPDVLAQYLVLEFETDERTFAPKGFDPVGHPPRLRIRYTPEEAGWDRDDDCPWLDKPTTVRYFFPVFDLSPRYRRNAWEPLADFKGIVVPDAVRVTGLYRVRDIEPFPILMNVWLPRDPTLFKKYCTLDAGF